MADNAQYEEIFAAQPPGVTARLKQASVGVAGAGGLGSVVAENLVRAGVRQVVVADHDVVEASNLNRQRYFLEQIGTPKVDALAENIARFNPFVDYVPCRERVTRDNCARIFRGCSVVAECLDDPSGKAELVVGLRKNLPGCSVVAASGLAGIDPGHTIGVRKVSDRFYLVGDATTETTPEAGVFAARVGVVACLQSLVIIRILAGLES